MKRPLPHTLPAAATVWLLAAALTAPLSGTGCRLAGQERHRNLKIDDHAERPSAGLNDFHLEIPGPAPATGRLGETGWLDDASLPTVEGRDALPGPAEGVSPLGRHFDPIYFEAGSIELNINARQRLRDDAEWLEAHPRAWLTPTGYDDGAQSLEYGLNLSMGRAMAVHDYFMVLGLDPGRFFPAGRGSIVSEDLSPGPAVRDLMRRVELPGFIVPEGFAGAERISATGETVPQTDPAPPPPIDEDL